MASPKQTAAAATPTAPAISPRQLMELYVQEKFEELSEKFLEVLRYFHNSTLHSLDKAQQYYVDAFVKVFLHLFTQTDFRPPDRHVEPYVRLNLTISNLVAMSAFRTADPYLEVLKQQPYNLAKILALLSGRDRVKLDRRAFFDAGAATASVWYDAYAQIYRSGLVEPQVVANLQDHYGYQDPRLEPNHEMQELYFGSTYVDGRCDRLIKPVINRNVQQMAKRKGVVIQNTPDPKKIAVLSGCWHRNHSVYRLCSASLRSLKGAYHLTFFRLGNVGAEPEVSLFDRVEQLNIVDGVLNIDVLRQNDFMVVYYPDIGMTPQSILLANLRLAPIQIMSLGHPVSTWGSEIDYFISGTDVEPPNYPERNYSERLVLLPGCGGVYNRPLYERRGRRDHKPPFVINCPWTAMKINHSFCLTLKKLVQRAKKWVRFCFFPGGSASRQNDFVPFVRSLVELLGSEHVEVVPGLPYSDYMARMENGDLNLDCYHFGGGNTVVDSLFLYKPIVTYEGDLWYNRIGSQLLRLAGLPELIATNEEQYLDISLRLINDEDYRQAIEQKLRRIDLDATVFSKTDAKYFGKAIDYLITHHEELKQDTERTPIRIER